MSIRTPFLAVSGGLVIYGTITCGAFDKCKRNVIFYELEEFRGFETYSDYEKRISHSLNHYPRVKGRVWMHLVVFSDRDPSQNSIPSVSL